nr:Gag-Pol polyprotein [Tanacetum cinerariifolium]
SDPAPTCQTMASVQISSDPAPECQIIALEHDSLSPRRKCKENVSHGDKTVTTSNELDLLFSLMFDELLNGTPKVVSKSSAVSAADAPNQRQQPTTPLNNHTTHAPTCQTPSITPTVISSENINQAEPYAKNDQVTDDEFINIFSTPVSKNDIVVGLPKLKFVKDHLCSSCELGKAKRKSFYIKLTPSSKKRLHLLHMDLCGPMRVASINGKRYVLVIVDDYSRYTWTHFLRSKDETLEVLIDFLRLVQRGLQAQVRV